MYATETALMQVLESEISEAMESVALEWGALIDPTEFLRDDPSFGYAIGPQDLRGDRKDGANFPVFRTEAELGIIRAIGRALGESTEHGLAVLETLASYTVGTGFQWNVSPVPAKKKDPDALAVAATAKAALENLFDTQSWTCDREEEFQRRAARDGEMFIAIMDDPADKNRVVLRFVEPSQVTEPGPSVQNAICTMYGVEAGCWSFGIHTRTGDVEAVLGYFVQWTDNANDWTYLHESRVVHWKRNVDSNVKRGVSDFYPCRQGQQKGRTLQSALTHGAATQAKIAWIQSYAENVTPADVSANISNQTTRQQSIPTAQRGAILRNVAGMKEGTVVHTQRTTYEPGPMGHAEKATGFIEVLAANLRTLGIRWMIPEFMISGDGSNANLASTLSQASPFGRARERDQFKLGAQQTKLIRKILALWCRRGMFQQWGIACLSDLLAVVGLTYTAPDVQVQDKAEQLDAAERKLAIGIPRSIVMQELGYTPEDLADQSAGTTTGAAADGSVVPASGLDGAAPVANTALNGAQVTSMIDIVGQVTTGAMPAASAKALTAAAFPAIPATVIAAILDPLVSFVPRSTPDGKPVEGGAAAVAGAPAMSAMSRLQQSRNFSSVFALLKQVAAGKATAEQAAILMKQLALPQEDIDALLADAADGQVEAPPIPGQATESAAVDLMRESARLVVESVHCERLPRDSAIAQLVHLHGIPQGVAETLIGTAGNRNPADLVE